MAIFTWKSSSVPEGMNVTQVYGIIFSKDGRILLQTENDCGNIKYSLIGGHPEKCDKGYEETLLREVWEEMNITVSEPCFIGYQEVDEENGEEPYAQVRMAALIADVGEMRPDLDNGKTYGRLLVPPMRAAELLGWGKIAYEQITAAINAKHISENSDKEEYI
jgi:ADP-ribose pyrophosphatase YjhB (NUDIX family)